VDGRGMVMGDEDGAGFDEIAGGRKLGGA